MQTLPAPLSKWLYFTVIPALLPLGWLAGRLILLGKPVGVDVLFGKGELLLACSAFAAAGLGDLIASGKSYVRQKLNAGGCCLLVLIIAIIAYADVGTWISERQDYGKLTFGWFSACWCVFSLVCGGACIILGQRR